MSARVRSFLLNEKKQSILCVAATIVVAGPLIALWLQYGGAPASYAAAVACVIAWTVFAVIQATAICLAYRGLAAGDLIRVFEQGGSGGALADTAGAVTPDAALPPANHSRSGPISAEGRLVGPIRVLVGRLSRGISLAKLSWHRSTHDRDPAPSWSVHVSILALLVVGGILMIPALRASPTVLLIAVAMVAASWVNVLVAYSVHYARLDTREPGFSFPGGQRREFVDYLYLALALQTTSGMSDVQAATVRARRATMGHSALAFVFNSALIAMIVSLLLGAAR